MNFDIVIENFGKIQRANLKISPFTVIAGSNSSGKSFVTKALYSFFSTINKDHVTFEAAHSISRVNAVFNHARFSINSPSLVLEKALSNFSNLIKDLEDTIHREYGEATYIQQFSRSYILKEKIEKIKYLSKEIRIEIKGKKKYEQLNEKMNIVNRLLKAVENVTDKPEEILSSQIEDGFKNALKENFQVQSLSELKNHNADEKNSISFNFDQLGSISINNEDISFTLSGNSIDEFQSLYNVVFLESPVYWKIRHSLERVREHRSYSRFINRQSSLLGVPKYFYDLMDLIEDKVKIDKKMSGNENVYSFINEVINGEIDIQETGEMFFKEKGSSKNIGLSTTATGVTSLGLISLLLKKNVIAKGSFIFVDEPEAHLHPAWQKVMIEVLYELSKKGINVVIASHSIDMMKYIENIMQELDDADIEKHFSINQLSSKGISVGDGESPLRRMASIKMALGESFYQMHAESKLL